MKSTLAFTRLLTVCTIALLTTTVWAQGRSSSGVTHASSATRYTSATNLHIYIDQLRLKAGASSDLYFAEAKAREECAVFGVIPTYADDAIRSLRNHRSKYAQVRIDMYERLRSRCQGFVQTTKHDRMDIPSLYKRAANKGSVAAIAHNLVADSPHMAGRAVLIRAQGIINTKNSAAIFELSNLFGRGGRLKLTNGISLNANQSVIMWRLVACDLGYDCSYSSSLVQQSCLFGGLCGSGGYRENIRNAGFPPDQLQEIIDAENRVMDAIHRGSAGTFIQPLPPGGVGSIGSDDGAVRIDASDSLYSDAPALHNVGVNSNYDVRSAGDTQAAGRYRLENGLFTLGASSTFQITYQDRTVEWVVVANPNSSLGAVPIPSSQSGGGGGGGAPPGGVIIPVGTGGSSHSYTCVKTKIGTDTTWTCTRN